MSHPLNNIGFYTSDTHPCSYLDTKETVTLFADPQARLSPEIYGHLVQLGFRRSGSHVYRPHCPSCSACIPLRLPVAEFKARRREQRILRKNVDLRITTNQTRLTDQHRRLYREYIGSKHPGGGMETMSDADIESFLFCDWSDTRLLELWHGNELVGVAAIDQFPDALSSVYTFYSINHAQRSLGSFAILKTIELAQRLNLRWLYIGYWIGACDKMSYKTQFRPFEYLSQGRWHRASKDNEIRL